ncbi:MAG TPA: class I tRNA ligase family protein, partial [Candidatus Woesebacteria bacterium]|nr:class I tRNA ligase family protein [Candidatus Woesebacteria bacterium]
IKLLAPLAPFIAEELYDQAKVLGFSAQKSVHLESWPAYDQALLQKEFTNLVVQVNGKLRAQFAWPTKNLTDQAAILSQAKNLEAMQKWLTGKTIHKEIYVFGKIVNFVTS